MSEAVVEPPVRHPVHPPSGAEEIVLEGRDYRFAVLYRINSHPLLAHVQNVQKIYIYIENTDKPAMLDYLEFVKEIVLPDGTQEAVDAAGYLELLPGDYIFARDMWGTGLAVDDVIQVWVTPKGTFSNDHEAGIKAARDAILGQPEDRTPGKPVIIDGQYAGGIAWERHVNAIHITNSERAYSLAQSYQVQKNLAGPTVGAKVPGGQATEHHELRLQTLRAIAPIAIASLETGPKAVSEALRLQAEVSNLPRIGYDGNYAFPTMQLNIAATKSADALAASEFKNDLGQFAGKHVDQHDSAGGYTCMVAMSDLELNDNPGYFMIAELGVAIALKGLVSCCFSGLRYHGGFPPTSPAGVEPSKSSYRFVGVAYPSSPMLDGSALVALGALPKGELLAITPEMKDPMYDNVEARTNNANWIADGPWLTTRQAYLDFVYRASGELLHYLTKQIPEELGFELDFERLREAMSLKDENDRRISPAAWDLHPGSTHSSSDFGCTREESVGKWTEHKIKHGRFLPHFVYAEDRSNKLGSRSNHNKAAGASNPANPTAPKRSRKRKATEAPAQLPPQSQASLPSSASATASPEPLVEDAGVRRSKRLRVHGSCVEADLQIAEDDDDTTVLQLASQLKPLSVAERSLAVQSNESLDGVVNENAQIRSVAATFNSRGSVDASAVDALQDEDLDMSSSDSEPESAVLMATKLAAPQLLDNVLDIFGLSNLANELERSERFAAALSHIKVADSSLGEIDAFFKSLDNTPHNTVAFASNVADLWRVWELQAELTELSEFTIALERRRLMVSNAAAWMWLTQDCIAHAHAVLTSILQGGSISQDADWRTLLIQDVYALWSQRKAGSLIASRYLPNMNVAPATVHVARPVVVSSPAEDVVQELTGEVIRIIRSWLSFPSNTNLLAAYFVMYIVTTLQNVDVLLFPDVWRVHQNIKTRLLGIRTLRHHSLKVSMLDPFLESLSLCPASNPLSIEAQVLQAISRVTDSSGPAMQGFNSLITEQLCISRGCPIPPGITMIPRYSRSQPAVTLAPSGSISLRNDTVVPPQALNSILSFIRQLIPLIHDPTAAQTPLQTLVVAHLDHYLPFREHAPSRLIVTSKGGPFHSSLVDAPGAFASQAMFRAYLFDSPALHGDHTHGYFEDVAAWETFLEDGGYDGTTQSVAWMVNMSCYGSAQAQRVTTINQISPFFDCEDLWTAFTSKSPGQVSFASCLEWLQSSKKVTAANGKRKNMKILPLFGVLTAYLLTADLVYAGKVTRPTLDELGSIIHSNNLGSRRCLTILSPQCGPSSSEADTILAFKEVYMFLNHTLTDDEKTSITFDGIMVEHLLCKYQRLLRRVGKSGMGEEVEIETVKQNKAGEKSRKGKGKGKARVKNI